MINRGGRIAWLDFVRGITICLVVLWHAFLAAQLLGPIPTPVKFGNYALLGLRMPLFFFCSGMLAYWGLRKSWDEIVRRRIGIMLWVILVWTCLSYAFDNVVTLNPWSGHLDVASAFWLPAGNLWFVYALLLVTIFARSVRDFPIVLQLPLTAGLHLLFNLLGTIDAALTQSTAFDAVARYAPIFFMAGIWLSPVVQRLFEEEKVSAAGIAAVAAVALCAMGAKYALPDIPYAVVAAPIVAATIAVAARYGEHIVGFGPLQALGRCTLEVFLAHQFVIAAVYAVLVQIGLSNGLVALAVIFPAALGVSVLAMRVMSQPGLNWLLRPPQVRRKPMAA
ncbi:acyltransferase family protein [uncultured Jannaschia sp.]|uniref:acyltransferase family protein n=1 Tax=uncultured Jannaschia sp. TaxID=293347 RepID=UPI00260A7065|nr:acyltransferase family protein [uncultured Jannaschia sp.]